MNLLAANDFTYYLKFVFADWAIALFIFFAVLILLAALFKGLKVGITLLIIASAIAGGFVAAAFIFMLITWDTLRIIDFAIKWIPTILFVTIITVSTLVNAKRGLRKSLILLAQAVGACIVCTIFYYVCVTSEGVDKAILSIINTALGQNTLQNVLGVSESCKTLRQILCEYLPKLIGGDFGILLAENPQYIVTLADMVFRIVFTVITLLIYFLLVFLLYVIYFFAYPERRYKKKVEIALSKNQTAKPYTKNHIGGGAVGLARGITVGLLSLSFIGSVFFIAAGGKGGGTLGDYDLGRDDYNYYYSIYRSIDSYGSQGIFKVLNSLTDADDTPFYLFAADMVLSGNLDDEENGIHNENIKFRKEIAAFTGFAKDTMNLLLKYGEEDIVPIINGQGGENAFNTIVEVMSDEGFREEFDRLIEEFDSQTYIINLGMSLVNSIVAHIDEISFTSSVSADNRELIKILFKKGYLSDVIPDELKLKQDIAAGTASLTEDEIRPRLNVSHLLNKQDVRIILQIALSFLSGEQNTKDVLSMIKAILPGVRELSILKTSRSGELDPVLARMYCYVENKYLTAEGEEGITYKTVKAKNIHWLNELNTLLDVADDAFTLWGNIYKEGRNALDLVLAVFDSDSPDYTENITCFDNIRSALETSDIIGTVMSTSFMNKMITGALTVVSQHIYIPENIVYNRKVDAYGNVVDEGELYKLFGGFRLLTLPENSGFLDEIMKVVQGGEADMDKILSALSDILPEEDGDGNTLSYYLTESALLRSLISIVIIDKGAEVVYIPTASLEKLENGDMVNMIEKSELKLLFDNLPELIEFVTPILSGGDIKDYIGDIAEYLQSEKCDKLLASSRICEGTVAHFLMDFLKDNEFTVVPKSLAEDMDGWITQNGKRGELRNLLAALKSSGIDIAEIAQGEFDTSSLLNSLMSMDSDAVEDLLNSRILHYTVSKYLIDGTATGGLEIIVPNGARVQTQPGDSIAYLVKKSEVVSMFNVVSRLGLSGEMDISSVLSKLVANKDIFDESRIISASVVYAIVNNDQISGSITIPENYVKAGSKDSLSDYNQSNVWNKELPRFIDALDEILGISSAGDDFIFDAEGIQNSLSSLLTSLNEPSEVNGNLTKLQICYRSDIVKSEITVRLDETLLDSGIVTEDVISDAKSHGYYKESELEALSNALKIFDIDLLNLDSGDMVDKVVGQALSLNEPREDFEGRTGLNVIYASNIIKYIFSNELDKALDGNIDSSVVRYIKNGSRYYDENEVAGFIDAVNELGIEDFKNVGDFDISTLGNLNGQSENYPESTRLEVIYSSRIAAGVITKNIYEGLNSGGISKIKIDHSKAYVENIKIYRFEEIESIYYIFYNSEDDNFNLEEFDLNDIDLKKVSERLYDENGLTRSYLIASAISAVFKDNENLIITEDALDEEGCIKPKESAIVIEVFMELYEGEDDLENLENWEITEIPKGEIREKMFSSVILRARVTYDIGEKSNTEKPLYVTYSEGNSEYVKIVNDINGVRRRVLSEKELTALANALDAMSDDNDGSVFELPTFTVDGILGYDEDTLNILMQSDILFIKICECLINDTRTTAYFADKKIAEDVIDLYLGSFNTVDILSEQTIYDFIEYAHSFYK